MTFDDLVRRARALVSPAGHRAVLGITGPPAAGKTTLAEELVAAIGRETPGWVAHVPMDGFHLADVELDRLGLRDRKGAPETFDAAGQTFLYVDPDADEITQQQQSYITGYLNSWQRATAASDGKDAMTGKLYGELIDKGAFIDHHILNMLAKNPDAFALSTYYQKDRNGPLKAGPVWDFDLAMGGNDPWGDRSFDPTHWGPGTSDSVFRREHYDALFDHAEFTQEYWARWDALLGGTLKPDTFHAILDGYKAQLVEAELRNRARWPEMAPRNDKFDDEVKALSNWLDARVAWIVQNKGVTPP